MIYLNQLEVMLFPKYSQNNQRQKELIMWLGTTARSVIGLQNEKAKKNMNRITIVKIKNLKRKIFFSTKRKNFQS